jgi:hypothetical protein
MPLKATPTERADLHRRGRRVADGPVGTVADSNSQTTHPAPWLKSKSPCQVSRAHVSGQADTCSVRNRLGLLSLRLARSSVSHLPSPLRTLGNGCAQRHVDRHRSRKPSEIRLGTPQHRKGPTPPRSARKNRHGPLDPCIERGSSACRRWGQRERRHWREPRREVGRRPTVRQPRVLRRQPGARCSARAGYT